MGALIHPPCRFCGAPLERVFVDLGMSPLSNAYLRADQLLGMEPFFPLRVFVCEKCLLVQLPAFEKPENIFADYAYFSSFSDSWLEHCRRYAAEMIARRRLGREHLVVEVASNDGYLLQFFRRAGVPVLGVEPAGNVADAAVKAGIQTVVEFFGVRTAEALRAEGRTADLLIGNNVLAHVPDINDFVEGLRILLKPGGAITIEFPHLLRLIEGHQFDTIYHEHFSYLSLGAVDRIFAAHDLQVHDVRELPTHGGSLRIYARHRGAGPVEPTVPALLARERAAGFESPDGYAGFKAKVESVKHALLEFLIGAKRAGQSVAGYGAAAKGNTLLNYCGIRSDFLDYVVDRSPYKQGRFLPGTHLPIHAPEKLRETRPDYVLILPWNLRDEIAEQMAHIREWGGRFVVPIPTLEILP